MKKCEKHPHWPKDECVWCTGKKKSAPTIMPDNKPFIDDKTFSKPKSFTGYKAFDKELKEFNKKQRDNPKALGRELTADKITHKKKSSKEEYKKTIKEAIRG